MYTTNGFNNSLESLKVDFYVVMNRDIERTLHRAHQHIGAFLIRGIDALFVFAAANSHPQVARNGHERDRSCAFHIMQNHERVAALAADVARVANIAVIGVAWVCTNTRV